MAFRVWFYFMLLTTMTLLFLWMLQISFIRPYYERNRTQILNQKASEIETLIKAEENLEESEELTDLLVKENMCGTIYDESGTQIVTSSGNLACLLDDLSTDSIVQYIAMAQEAPSSEFSIRFSSDIFEQGMYFYGAEVEGFDEGTYYMFINSPLELLDSTVFVLRRQFALLASIVFTMATAVAFLLSRHLARPIERLTGSAHSLAEGDFEAEFDGEGYSEMETLATTLNYATEEFKKTDDLRRDLVANVSHDYKTPLTMIRAYAEMIQDISGDDSEKRNEHLNVILQEVNHLETLVNDMLTLSKYESAMYTINKTKFNLKNHLNETLALLEFRDWDITIYGADDKVVYDDEIKMGQVLYNLLSNALKYASKRQKLDIIVEEKRDNFYIYVKDYGPGLSEKEATQIWDRYYKVDKNYYRENSQSGLGLSIVKAICKANSSDFGVESVLGEGTKFYYSLAKDN